MNIRGACATVCLPLVALLLSACMSAVDLKQTLQVTDTSGGWYDAGIVGGKNKLVPSVTFRVRKTRDANLRGLSLNVVFKRLTPGPGTEEEFDDVFIQNVDFAEGNHTAPITARTVNGYTGEPPQSRAEMLQNSQFRDVRARVFAKIGASQWAEVAAIDVPRVILTK